MGCSASAPIAPDKSAKAGPSTLSEPVSQESRAASGGIQVTRGTAAGAASDHYEFQVIFDKYETYDEIQDALRSSGLESSNMVIAVDYTKSN